MNRIVIFLIFCLTLVLSASPAYTQSSRAHIDVTPYIGIQNYSWSEREDDGEHFVNESGYRYTAALKPRISLLSQNRLLFEADLRYTFGKINYDGFLLMTDGKQTSFITTTAYSGFETALFIGHVVRLNNAVRMYPLAGAGFEFWQRHLDESGTMGYTENYSVLFAKAGLRVEYSPSNQFELTTSGFIKKPFSASLTIPTIVSDEFDVSQLHLILPKNPSWQFMAGVKWHDFFIITYYDTWNLGKSSVDHGFYLPNTKRTQKGLKIGYSISITK